MMKTERSEGLGREARWEAHRPGARAPDNLAITPDEAEVRASGGRTTRPQRFAAPVLAVPLRRSAQTSVASTASCAPWYRGSPSATTSMRARQQGVPQ